jgi:hypothetical protein
MVKTSALTLRIDAKKRAALEKVAHFRFVEGSSGMANDSASEYVRTLINQDMASAVVEIEQRRGG